MPGISRYPVVERGHRVASWPMQSTPQLGSESTLRSSETSGSGSGSDSSRWSLSTSGTTEDEEDDADLWNLVDAAYDRSRLRRKEADDSRLNTGGTLFKQSLISELDGSTFGAYGEDDISTNRVPLSFGKVDARDEELYIPHFPALTAAVVGAPGLVFPGPPKRDSAVVSGPKRTSEPISQGINMEREAIMRGHMTKDKFQSLLDSQVGLARFREWLESDGYNGSRTLLKYYQDALAQTAGVTRAMEGFYFGGEQAVSWHQQLLVTRPSDSLGPLSATLEAVERIQNDITDKLYAAEFNRFITGKISAHARFCLEHFSSWRDRGDIGDIFCLVDPHLPDQPMILMSDGFCRLTEYPRETLIGRNCRFLQGPATDQDSVNLLRQAIKEGREHCSMLMNYTRTGKAFWNLFNMIPLRGPTGSVDYFLGAQVDCSKALTAPSTFQALTGLHDGDRNISVHEAPDRFAFSEDVLGRTDSQLNEPSVFRKLSPAPTPIRAAGKTFQTPRLVRTDGNRRTGATQRTSPGGSVPAAVDPTAPIPIPQEVPNPVRAHMTAFSSAFSKLIVFDARTGAIKYITPPLLATLGYPIKYVKDRAASFLVGSSILDLIIGESRKQTISNRDIVRLVISNSATHSLFTGLECAEDRRLASIAEDGQRGRARGEEFKRFILHFAPMKNKAHVAVDYVVVVG